MKKKIQIKFSSLNSYKNKEFVETIKYFMFTAPPDCESGKFTCGAYSYNQTYCIPPHYRYNTIKRTAYPLTTGTTHLNVLHTPSLQVQYNQTYCRPPHNRFNTIKRTAYPLATGTIQSNVLQTPSLQVQ